MTIRVPRFMLVFALLFAAAAAAGLSSDVASSAPQTAGEAQKRGETLRKRALENLPQPGSKRQAPTAIDTTEKVEADVSTRTIAVTSGFTGTEIIVFGAVDNSRQEAAEAGYYDIVIAIEGASTPLAVRKKSKHRRTLDQHRHGHVRGRAELLCHRFDAAGRGDRRRAHSRAECHRPAVRTNGSGCKNGRVARAGNAQGLQGRDREAQAEGGAVREERLCRGLHRAQLVPQFDRSARECAVGQLSARVYLFRQGEIISTYSTRVKLEREGVERLLHRFATHHPLWYGLFTVAVAMLAGLVGSWLFPRKMA